MVHASTERRMVHASTVQAGQCSRAQERPIVQASTAPPRSPPETMTVRIESGDEDLIMLSDVEDAQVHATSAAQGDLGVGYGDEEMVQPLHDSMNEIERLKDQNHILRQRYDHQAKALQNISEDIMPFGRSINSLQSSSSEWKHANTVCANIVDHGDSPI